MIQGKDIVCSFSNGKKNIKVLDHVSFVIEKGRINTFMGKSGAGKTTLLKCVANLYAHYQGEITVEGENLKDLSAIKRSTQVGYVFQQYNLFPHLSVLQNCTFALQRGGMEKTEAEELAKQTLTVLGMAPFIQAMPARLSGGQCQRVAIARALVLSPKILLLDEPTSALDPESKKSLETLLLTLKEQGITLAISSHDMPFIQKLQDKITYLEGGKVIEEWDSKKEALAPNSKIKKFLSH